MYTYVYIWYISRSLYLNISLYIHIYTLSRDPDQPSSIAQYEGMYEMPRYSAHIVETNETVAIKKAGAFFFLTKHTLSIRKLRKIIAGTALLRTFPPQKHRGPPLPFCQGSNETHWSWGPDPQGFSDVPEVFVDRRYRNRELQVWREMHHPNIVTLKAGQRKNGKNGNWLFGGGIVWISFS